MGGMAGLGGVGAVGGVGGVVGVVGVGYPYPAWPLRTNQDNVGADLHGEDLFGSTATARRAKE